MLPKRGISGPWRTGWLVFVVLLALVLLEYVVFLVLESNLPLMVAMPVADASLIVYDYMHVSRLWRRGEREEGA
jgi:hypothetical protein